MSKFIQKLIRYGQHSLFKVDKKLQQPLLNNDEILELLLRVQSAKKKHSHKQDIAFRQIGDSRSIYRGRGMDYEESRQYQPGDDPRYMNWQLSARTGQHYMKVFREERQPGVFILVDRRHSMRFGTKQYLKVTQAVRAAAIAAFTALENNHSVGGVILDKKLEWFKDNHSKQSIFDFIHQAARPALPAFDKQVLHEPELEEVLRLLNEVLTKGSTIYLISDFHDIDEASQSALLQLSSAHRVLALQITDPAETRLPKAGAVALKSVSSNKQIYINTNSSVEQNNYESSSADHFSKKKRLFENIAISYKQIFTTENKIENKVIL